MITPSAMPGAAASITLQNDNRRDRIAGNASRMAPLNPPSSEMPPCHTFRTSRGEE